MIPFEGVNTYLLVSTKYCGYICIIASLPQLPVVYVNIVDYIVFILSGISNMWVVCSCGLSLQIDPASANFNQLYKLSILTEL